MKKADPKTEFLIEFLEGIAEGTVDWPMRWTDGRADGLCEALLLIQAPRTCIYILDNMFEIPYWWTREFEYFSGDIMFPIDGGGGMFYKYSSDPVGDHDYGDCRREYAQHVAEYLKHWRR